MKNLGEVEIDETPRFDLDSNDIDPSPRWIFIIFMLGISKYFTRSELDFLQHFNQLSQLSKNGPRQS